MRSRRIAASCRYTGCIPSGSIVIPGSCAGIFDDNITELEALAAKPYTTLGDLFDRVTEQAIWATALIDTITSDPHDPRAAHLGTRVTGVAATILAREQAAGRIGSHVTAADVMLAISMLAAEDERMAVARRARRIFEAAFGRLSDACEYGARPAHPG